MNEALNTNYLSALKQESKNSEFYNQQTLLETSTPFTEAPKLLFPIPTNRNRLIDLYIDDFIRIFLHQEVNS